MKQNKVPKNEYTKGEPSPYRKNPFKKDVFYGDDGQYAYPGQVTRIPGDAFGTHITMKGINQPLYARDDQGNEQMMQPGEEYQFPGQYVTEYPQIAKNGGGLLNKTLTCSSCGWSWKAVDGGKDIASCHKCGGTAKMQKGGANRSDSLALYNNSLQIKNFYDKLKPFYKKPEIDINDYRTTYNPFEDIDSGKTQRETLASDQLTSTNKNIIRANKDPNIQYLSDMVTGMIDPSAPLLRYDKRIKPQGQVIYDPYDPYLNKLTAKNIKYDIPGYTEAEMYFEGIADIPQYRNAAENIAKKSGTSLEELSKLGKLSSKIRKLLPGNITRIPYYDPLAIKPVDLLTEAEKVERIKKYGTSGFPKGYTQAKEEPKMYAKKADYEKSKKQQRIAPISVTDPYSIAQYKKPVQPYVLKKQEVVPQEMVDYLQQKQVDLPTQQQEPELRIPTTPKDTTAGKRIAWRKDPNTKKMVPVIGGMKESVKNMKRLYNKDIPSSTGAIPADFNPDYGDVATFQNGGWLDELDEEYKRGGMVNPLMKSRSKRSGTSKNIQSSINKIFLRNHDIFGPGGKNIYNPKSKYQTGGGWLDNLH
jgi:hypothetical protein